ncbi:glycine--tRNA ligase-like isoform X2 [Dysidea avara]|uniref:glycine--tRNA ligase-like isoform X2 n=1 Tax=Dysidea avara TaxID=196820 RepID=UPI00331E3860
MSFVILRCLRENCRALFCSKSPRRPILFSHLRLFSSMATNENPLAPLRAAVKEQGDVVRRLKEEGKPKGEITEAVAKLKEYKKKLEDGEKKLLPKEIKFDREGLESLLKRRFFFAPSFSIYGGVAGLYDYGPMGCAMIGNIMSLWRSHFVLEDQLLEVACSMLTPYPVLKASGHVDRFADYMVKDVKTGECFRADKLLVEHIEQLLADPKCPSEKKEEYNTVLRKVESYSVEELGEVIAKYKVVSPINKNEVSPPQPFNLMFGTDIGPDHGIPAFLRPETSQGIFVNFKRLLEFNNGRLPFGAAQIGHAFRNEVSPRAGLLRVREFMMAEIEYFVHPNKKQNHNKFSSVSQLVVTLFSSGNQMSGEPAAPLSLGDAVKQGLIANETVGYYLGRIFLFLKKIGVDEKKLRFRQHLDTEMAHYACDCWDAECHTSYGWVECVGCADRSCYDLNCHMKHSGANLYAQETLTEPRTVQRVQAVSDKSVIGKAFRAKSKIVMQKLSEMSNDEVEELDAALKKDGTFEVQVSPDESVTILPNMVNIKRFEEKIHVEDVLPSVIEPSFGIGRIMYSVLEHNYHVREGDENRGWLSLPAIVAPTGCSVLPLSSNEKFDPFVKTICG